MPVVAIPLAEWVIPVALLLLSMAVSYLLVKPLTWFAQQIPPVAGMASSAAVAMGANVAGWAKSWLDGAAGGLIGLASGVIGNAYGLAASTLLAVQYLAAHAQAAAWGLAQVPGQVLAAQQTAERAATALVHEAEQAAAVGAIRSEALAAQYARGLVAEATRAAAADAARVSAYVTAQAHLLEGELASAEARQGVALDAAVHALEGTIATDLSGVHAQLGDLESTLAGLGVASLTAEITQVATQVSEIPMDCIASLCNPASPLQGLLGSLLTAADIALILGLVADGIRDPEGAAHSFGALASPFVGPARAIAQSAGIPA